MAERHVESQIRLVVENDQPLIAVPLEEDSREVVHYFTDEGVATAALPRSATQDALAAIGSWSDLDWEDMQREINRIGHENPPTPPIEKL